MAEGEELVRTIWARWNSGDRELRADEVDPEIEIHSALTNAVYRGYEGAERWMHEIDDQFSDWRLELDSIDERQGGDVVVATGSISMRGRQSGLDLRQPAGWVVELRAGRLLTLHNFIDPDEAAAFAARAR
jgi:ketosteroid isomerase-like protein